MSSSIDEKFNQLQTAVNSLQSWVDSSSESLRRFMDDYMTMKWSVPNQMQMMYGMHMAICVDTIDPWKQGGVRFFSPLLHEEGVQIGTLPYAMPISAQGGFDDSGCTWVPPAGSKLCLVFESGHRQTPYYIGTTWDRSRRDGWGISIKEFEKIHRGHRGGYLVGDEDQVFPPWNTENYNGFDIDSFEDFASDTNAQNDITYPNIYGWKTPQKHMIKMVDGNYKCNMRWQRLEIKSSQGNHLIFKDDRVHPAAQWANPDCGCGGGNLGKCNDGDTPIEKVDQCPSGASQEVCANPYFKHRSECRPYAGPGNPQNNKVDKTTLPQSGIQLTSLSGHTFWMDDSVNEPKGSNEWENGLRPFEYGCDEVFKGRTVWKSAHGHQIVMSDIEPEGEPKTRNDENFIRIITATGNKIELNDDTKGQTCRAGPKRGIELQSTSNHIIQMVDENNEQCSPERREGGVPINEATDAFVKIRTGYGLEIMMADDNSQKETQSQYLQLLAPQKDACCGPHMIRMQESDYCGYIFVRAGGDYMCITEGDHVTVVGVGESTPEDDFCKGGCLGPRNMFTAVSQHTVHWSCNFYFNKAEMHLFLADKMILLLAGKDCPPPPGEEECIPCVGPVAVLLSDPITKKTRLVASDRVFASASLESKTIPIASLFEKKPGVNCPPEEEE